MTDPNKVKNTTILKRSSLLLVYCHGNNQVSTISWMINLNVHDAAIACSQAGTQTTLLLKVLITTREHHSCLFYSVLVV